MKVHTRIKLLHYIICIPLLLLTFPIIGIMWFLQKILKVIELITESLDENLPPKIEKI